MTQRSLYSHDLLAQLLVDKLDQVHIPKHKLVFGTDGLYVDVTDLSPYPVTDTASQAVETAILAELVVFHSDNSSENGAILTELQDFHTDNTSENASILSTLDGINAKIFNNYGAASGGIRTASQLADGAGNPITSQLIDSINNYRAIHATMPDRLISASALGSLNAAVTISLEGSGSAGFQLSSGTLAATLTPEQSLDGGTSWVQAQFFDPVTFTVNNSLVVTNPNALNALGIISVQGSSHVRVRVSAYTSGTANGVVRSVAAAGYQAQVPQDLSDIAANRIFCFAIDTINMASAGTNNPLILIDNPSGSGKSLYLKTITAGISVNNVFAIFEVYGNPTVTANGTAGTIRNRTIGSSISSVASLYTLPTVSDPGNIRSAFLNAQNANSLPVIDPNQLKVPPGQKLLFTGNPQSNNRNAVITLVWSET